MNNQEIDKRIAEDFPETVAVAEQIGEFEYNENGVCLNSKPVLSKSLGCFIYELAVARTRTGWDNDILCKTVSQLTGASGQSCGAWIDSVGYKTEFEAKLAGAKEILWFFKDQMKRVPQLKKHASTLNALKYWIEQWEKEIDERDPDTFIVDNDTFNSFGDKCDLVGIQNGKVKALITLVGKKYCLTAMFGTGTGTGWSYMSAYEAVELDNYKGFQKPVSYAKHCNEVNAGLRERNYDGIIVKCENVQYVLVGPQIGIRPVKTINSTKRKRTGGLGSCLAGYVRTCRTCGCTDDDCSQCIEKTGHPCYWVEEDLCSACVETVNTKSKNKKKMPRKSKKQVAVTREPVEEDFLPDDNLRENSKPNSGAKATLKMIPVDFITPDAKQPRKFFDKVAQDELTESIRQNGVLQPILVRPDDTEEERYLLVCGERRLRSAKEAGIKEVPAVIRQMGNSEALELQIVENLQRKDVHPMEEAAGFKSLYDGEAFTIEEIAGRVGKSHAYVAQRIKLNDLLDDFQEMFFRDLLTLTEANKLARIAPESQQAILDEIINRARKKDWRKDENFNPENIDWYLNQESKNLSNADFKLSDAKLYPEAGPCTKCPHNSANAPLLFPDIQKGRFCSNSVCFNIKTQRAYKQNIEKYAADPEMLFVAKYHYSNDDRQKVATAEEIGLKVLNDNQFQVVVAPGEPENEDDYIERNYSDFLPWEESEDEEEEAKAIKEAKIEAKEAYTEYLEDHQAEVEEFEHIKKKGLVRKAYVVVGHEAGKVIDVIIKGSDKKKESLDDTLSIDQEIARIKAKEKRNQELDRKD